MRHRQLEDVNEALSLAAIETRGKSMGTDSQTIENDEHHGRRHHDASQVFRLMLGRRIASMIEADPSILDQARRDLERKRRDPHLRHGVETWDRLFANSPTEIARRLRADDPDGDYVRETMPRFGVIDQKSREDLVRQSRKAFNAERLTR